MLLSIRKLGLQDAGTLASWITDERELIIWGGPYFDFPLTVSAVKELITDHEGQKPARECWAVTSAEAEFVGSFQLTYNYRSGQSGLGRVVIKPQYRGRGLAGEILVLAERKAFSRPEVNRLELRVFTFNEAAIAAYKRAGFVDEGIARQSARYGTEYWDTMIMSKLRSELLT